MFFFLFLVPNNLLKVDKNHSQQINVQGADTLLNGGYNKLFFFLSYTMLYIAGIYGKIKDEQKD